MGANSAIEWTHHTFNPWRGCTKVSAGCANCYAETLSNRNPAVLGQWGPSGTRVVASAAMWREPHKWNRAAEKAGERHRVFCASLADVMEGPETMSAEAYHDVASARIDLWRLIAETPSLDWLLLTKRPANIMRFAPPEFFERRRNVWTGTSVEDQPSADLRIPELLKVPGRHFLSMEPLLGPVDLDNVTLDRWTTVSVLEGCGVSKKAPCQSIPNVRLPNKIDWVIVGGESGPGVRPMHPYWVRSIRDQCAVAGVPFLFKQWGEWTPCHVGGSNALVLPDGSFFKSEYDWCMAGAPCPATAMRRAGKKSAGRLLDGREHNDIPEGTT